MHVKRIGALLCVGVALTACRPEQVAAPNSALSGSLKRTTGSPVTYSSITTGVLSSSPFNGGFKGLTVIGLQTGTGKPYGITLNPGGGWAAIGALPNPSGIGFTAVSTGSANNSNLQLVGFTNSGTNYLIYQGYSDGAWHWVGALPGTTNPPVTTAARGQPGWDVNNGNSPSYFFPGVNGTPLGASSYVRMPWQDENAQWQPPFSAFGSNYVMQVASGWDFSYGLPYLVELVGQPGTPGGGPVLWGQSISTKRWVELDGTNVDPQNILYSMVVTARGNGSDMQMIGLGASDGKLYLAYDTPQQPWNWWGPLPNPGYTFTSVVADTGNADNLQVIAIDAASKQPMLTYQDSHGNWFFHGYLPDPNHVQCQSLTTGAGNNGGNLQVICLGLDGLPYLIWQSHSDGSWHWYGALPQNF